MFEANPRHSQKREQEAWLKTTVTMALFEHHITSTLQVSPTTPKPDPQHVLQLPSPAKPEPRKAHPDSNAARKPHASSTGFDQRRRTSKCPQASGPAAHKSSQSSTLCSRGCSQAQSAASSTQLPPDSPTYPRQAGPKGRIAPRKVGSSPWMSQSQGFTRSVRHRVGLLLPGTIVIEKRKRFKWPRCVLLGSLMF